MGLTLSAISRFRSRINPVAIEVFRERLESLGEEITLGSSDPIRVLIANGDYTRELVEGGFADEGTVRLHFLASDLPQLPAPGVAAQFQGRPYRVHKARRVPGTIHGELELRPTRR